MPDAQGNFKSAFYGLSDERHALIFGECSCEHPLDCENADDGCKVEAVLKENAPHWT